MAICLSYHCSFVIGIYIGLSCLQVFGKLAIPFKAQYFSVSSGILYFSSVLLSSARLNYRRPPDASIPLQF